MIKNAFSKSSFSFAISSSNKLSFLSNDFPFSNRVDLAKGYSANACHKSVFVKQNTFEYPTDLTFEDSKN